MFITLSKVYFKSSSKSIFCRIHIKYPASIFATSRARKLGNNYGTNWGHCGAAGQRRSLQAAAGGKRVRAQWSRRDGRPHAGARVGIHRDPHRPHELTVRRAGSERCGVAHGEAQSRDRDPRRRGPAARGRNRRFVSQRHEGRHGHGPRCSAGDQGGARRARGPGFGGRWNGDDHV